jgi:3-dehydroquinate dehydratase II
MSTSVFFLNGPGANLYGLDPSGVYGTESFPQIEARCRKHAASLDIALDFRQSNHEGELIDWIQEARRRASGLIINGAGLTYTSIALLDALLAFGKPVMESAHEQHLPARAVPASLVHLQGGDRHRRRPRPDGL